MFRIRTILFTLIGLLVLGSGASLEAQAHNLTLTLDSLLEAEDDEDPNTWDSDVVNLTVDDPGVLLIEAAGADVEGASGSEDKCGGSRSVGASWLPLTQGARSIHLRPGDYSLDILPHDPTTWIEHRIRFRLRDYCGSSCDDHCDNKLCSSEICFSSTATSGEIEDVQGDDEDFFSFVVTSDSTSVTIESTGSTDVEADLYDENGKRLASDDDSGSGTNFKIVETLDAGRYFFRVRGVNSALGTYSVTVQ